jgi:hypothetical protein
VRNRFRRANEKGTASALFFSPFLQSESADQSPLGRHHKDVVENTDVVRISARHDQPVTIISRGYTIQPTIDHEMFLAGGRINAMNARRGGPSRRTEVNQFAIGGKLQVPKSRND